MTSRRAGVPAAGLGPRLLPLTKAMPKQMLPIGGRPVIEHTVRELVASGITDITVVGAGRGKDLIRDHFRPDPALIARLRAVSRWSSCGRTTSSSPRCRAHGNDAPSAYAAIGGYVVTPGIIEELRAQTERWYPRRTGEPPPDRPNLRIDAPVDDFDSEASANP